MMTKREFINTLKEEVREYLPDDVGKDIVIDDVTVVKMNDQKLQGLTFKMPGTDKAPTLYVNDLYEEYKNGADFKDLAGQVVNMYSLTRNTPAPPDIDLSFDSVRDKLTLRLVEKMRNRDFLMDSPYVSVGHGLAVIADINMGEDRGGDWRINVNNGVLEQIGVDRDTLFAEAMSNSIEIEPPVLIDMSDALFSQERVNLLDRSEPIAAEDVGNMYVLTNASGTLGAATLFYPDVKEKAAALLGSDYYILPSSTHEVILVPDSPAVNAKDLCDMVKQANRTVVEEKDVLSDSVYHYSRNERRLDRVSPDHERADRVAEGR